MMGLKKKILLILILAAPLFLWAAQPDTTVRLVLVGPHGPVSISLPANEAAQAAVDYRNGVAAVGEGALRLLVNGLPDHPSFFPADAKVDRVAYDNVGFTLYLTLPEAVFAAGPREEITDDMMRALAKTAAGLDGAGFVRVMARLNSRQKYQPVGELLSPPPVSLRKPLEDGADYVGPQGFSQPQTEGFLSGRSVFLSPGHGWYYHDSSASWLTQRGNTNGIVEDLSNAEPVLQYLMPYLWNAGAGVYPVREGDLNTEMFIVDNGDPNFSTTGEWSSSTSTSGYYGDDYLVAAVSTTETATATFTAPVAENGFYHVYLWYTMGANRALDCRITVDHADGSTEIVQSLQRDGYTWKNLGRFYFLADDPPQYRRVVISNQGADPATYVIADAVRFGGGIHEDADKPRWEMSGMYHAPFMGCPQCVTNTVTTMPLYTQWEHEAGWEDGIYLSWHTNAPDPGTGTSSFAYSSYGWDGAFNGVPGSLELRDFVHEEIVGDIRAGWDLTWHDRGTHTNWYGEINPNYNAETPGLIFEVAFHDTPSDAEQIKEPGFRKLVARAVYQAVVRYFADRDGLTPHFLPEPPEHAAVLWNNGEPIIVWTPPPYDYGGLAGDPAQSYRVYLGFSGKGFADAIVADETRAGLGKVISEVKAGDGAVWYARVTAVNEGGESFPTETLAFSTGDGPRVLLVNGFDRLDKYANVPESYYGGGTIYRGYLWRMNSYDYVIAHARALAAAGVEFDSAGNEAVVAGMVNLADYPAVVWITGEESVDDESFSLAEQEVLSDYLDGGGSLFVSGSEIGWDLWEWGSYTDQYFYQNYLQAEYIADSSYTGEVTPAGIFTAASPFTFDWADYQIYAAYYPDCLAALGDGSVDMQYTGTGLGAAVVADTGVFKVVHLGFPFETIYDLTAREQIMTAAMDFLLPTVDDDIVDDDVVDDDVVDDDMVDDDVIDDDVTDDDTIDDDITDDDVIDDDIDDDAVDDDLTDDDTAPEPEDDDAAASSLGQIGEEKPDSSGCGC